MVYGLLGRWQELRRLKHQVTVARLKAEESLAAYYIKSHIEWDMKWTGHALDRTHKDEYLILLWSIPTIGLFIPGLREFIQPGFEALKAIHESAPAVFLYGWCTIFAATFGMKHAMNLLNPNRAATLMSSMTNLREDVPMEAAKAAQATVDATSGMANLPTSGERVY